MRMAGLTELNCGEPLTISVFGLNTQSKIKTVAAGILKLVIFGHFGVVYIRGIRRLLKVNVHVVAEEAFGAAANSSAHTVRSWR
jgi:hypothetical protein